MRNKKNIKIFCHGRFHFLLFSLENNNLEKYKSHLHRFVYIQIYDYWQALLFIARVNYHLYHYKPALQAYLCVGVLYGPQHRSWQTLVQSLKVYPNLTPGTQDMTIQNHLSRSVINVKNYLRYYYYLCAQWSYYFFLYVVSIKSVQFDFDLEIPYS